MFLRGLQGRFGRDVVVVENVVDAGSGGVELFRIGQNALLGFEGFVFAGFGGGGLDFAGLEAPQVGKAEAILLVMLERGEALLNFAPTREGIRYSVRGNSAEAVEEDALLGGIESGDGFRLRVDEGELRSEGAENGDGGRLVVHVDAALPVGEDFATEDHLVAVHIDAVGFEDERGARGAIRKRRTGRRGRIRGGSRRSRPSGP